MTCPSEEEARAMLARVRSAEDLLDDEPFLSQTEWLMLPVAKQETVLRRLGALRDYDAVETPTAADALGAAKAAGVAIVRFYQLVSHWRASGRSPFALVPHQRLGAERPTRLAAQETADAILASIRTFLATDPLAPTGRVISHVRRTWKGPGELPSDTALRAFHDRVLRSARPTPGTLTLSAPGQPQEEDVVAERLGETLVIDHVAIRGLVAEEDWMQPSVTVAIDLWSGAPLGGAALAGPPGPDGLVLALRDASRRLAESGSRSGTGPSRAAPPRLVIATTFARRWTGLVDALLTHGHEVVERRVAFLQQGGPSRRLLGMRIGNLRLERRASRREQFDPRTTAMQPVPVINRMLREEIDCMAGERVPPGAWTDAAPFEVHGLESLERWSADDGEEARMASGPDRPRDGGRMRERLERLAAGEDGRPHRISLDQAGVWRVEVEVPDPSARDATFADLARRAMELSAEHGVPIVVDVHAGLPRRTDA